MIKITFENLCVGNISRENFIYKADGNGNLLMIKFPIEDISYDFYGEYVNLERIVNYNDIVDVKINDTIFKPVWSPLNGENNKYQKGKFRGGIVTIKWKGVE